MLSETYVELQHNKTSEKCKLNLIFFHFKKVSAKDQIFHLSYEIKDIVNIDFLIE